MEQRKITTFVLYAIAFAMGIASFVISVLSAALYTEIEALLAIGVFCLGFAGIFSGTGVPRRRPTVFKLNP
jgi:hypothetical protein